MKDDFSARRWTRGTWIEFAFVQLRAGGPDALKLDRITAAAGKTRGSFYAHFPSLDAFLGDVVDAWIDRETTQPLARARALPEGERQREALVEIAAGMDAELHRQMRRLAAGHPGTAQRIEAMDAARIAFATDAYGRALGLDPEGPLAGDIALLAYAAVVGLQMLAPLPRAGTDWGDLYGRMAAAHVRALDAEGP